MGKGQRVNVRQNATTASSQNIIAPREDLREGIENLVKVVSHVNEEKNNKQTLARSEPQQQVRSLPTCGPPTPGPLECC